MHAEFLMLLVNAGCDGEDSVSVFIRGHKNVWQKKPRLGEVFVRLLIDVIRGLEYWKLACLSGLA